MTSVVIGSDTPNKSTILQIGDAYTECERITKTSSTSFMRSFRYLDDERRNAVYALYAFCRRVDDIVDGDWEPEVDLSRLNVQAEDTSLKLTIDRQSESSLVGDAFHRRVRALLWFHENLDIIESHGVVEAPIFIALQDTIERFPIQISELRMLLDGMTDDLFPTEYQSFEDMRTYCYKVASTVGLSLIEIYGYTDPNAREHAEEMGIFLQMINVLRDIEEDISRGRVYLPREELARFGIEIDELNHANLPKTQKWKDFIRHYIHRTQTHRDNAMRLLPLLDPKARRSPEMMCAIYTEILREVERRDGDVFSSRLQLGFIRKIRFALSTFGFWPNQI